VRAVFVAMAAAVLFGAVHAMMPGHGKTVLVSYVGQNGRYVWKPCHRCPVQTVALF
jgi:ABC-type nickel/cobalt efflux system permease component RcnA